MTGRSSAASVITRALDEGLAQKQRKARVAVGGEALAHAGVVGRVGRFEGGWGHRDLSGRVVRCERKPKPLNTILSANRRGRLARPPQRLEKDYTASPFHHCFSGPSRKIAKCRCGAFGGALPVVPT